MNIHDVMRTTFAAREFTSDPVSDETLERILDNARFAPSGGNRQGWRVIVVRDQKRRAALVPLIEPTMRRYRAQVRAGENPFNTVVPSAVSREEAAAEILPEGSIESLVSAPVLLIVLVDLSVVASMDSDLDRVGVVSGASIYPFVWNVLLCARNEGLGGVLTTFLAASETQVRAMFDIPENYAVCAMLPIGKPVKQLTRLRRNPVAAFTTVDSFGGTTFGSG